MKYLILSGLLICLTAGAYAQTPVLAAAPASAAVAPVPASSGPSGAAASHIVYVTPANQWSLVDMKVNGDVAYFHHIDGLASLRVFVTGGDGNPVMDKQISTQANGINFKQLKKGLYFLTLVNEATEERKAFTLNRE